PRRRRPEDERQENGDGRRQQDFLAEVQGRYRRRADQGERYRADQARLRGGVHAVEQLHGAMLMMAPNGPDVVELTRVPTKRRTAPPVAIAPECRGGGLSTVLLIPCHPTSAPSGREAEEGTPTSISVALRSPWRRCR